MYLSFQYGVNLGDMQFLYIDLVITTTIAVLSKYFSYYYPTYYRKSYMIVLIV